MVSLWTVTRHSSVGATGCVYAKLAIVHEVQDGMASHIDNQGYPGLGAILYTGSLHARGAPPSSRPGVCVSALRAAIVPDLIPDPGEKVVGWGAERGSNPSTP